MCVHHAAAAGTQHPHCSFAPIAAGVRLYMGSCAAAGLAHSRVVCVCVRLLCGVLLQETTQIVRIRNVRVSLIHLFAQLLIIGYVVGYGLIFKKSYQTTGSDQATHTQRASALQGRTHHCETLHRLTDT